MAELFAHIMQYQQEIWKAIYETFFMVGISVLSAIFLGLPLGTVLYLCRKGQLYENRLLFSCINVLVNVVRSFPFLLLVVFIIPFTRWLVGTGFGTTAASVPLAIVAAALYARLAEQALLEVPRGVVEAALSMGAGTFPLLWKFIIPEARSGLIVGLTTATISFISYSTVVGVVGGGGIGDFAIRYGYQRFETGLMLFMIVVMLILVQGIQYGGSALAKWLDKR